MEFEDILLEVGDYGKFQKTFLMVFIIPVTTVIPWFWVNLVFMSSTPDHWCHVPELANSNLSVSKQRQLIGPPGDASCSMYNLNYSTILHIENFSVPQDTEIIPCTNGWQFDRFNWDTTLASKWNLVCNDDHYTSFIMFFQILGSFIGNPIFGALADKFGRRITTFMLAAMVIATESTSVFATNFTFFVVLRCINGAVLPVMFVVPYILASEIIAPSKRSYVNGIMSCCFTVGTALMPVIAYFSRTWETLSIVNALTAVLIMLYWNYLFESPSWLVSQGKYDEATTVMMRIGTTNGKTPKAENLLAKLKGLGEKKKKAEEGDRQSCMSIFKYPRLRKHFLILTFCWVADNIAYIGLILNSVHLEGNEFVNFFLQTMVEIPGVLAFWWLMDRCGRRWTSTVGFMLTAIVCFITLIDFPYSALVSTMLGKFVIYGIMLVTDQMGSEIYPTVMRSIGMSIGKSMGAAISMLAPYLVYLSVYGKAIPFVIIGSTCIASSFLVSFLPETLNENLPQSVTDAEQFGKDRKFFSWIRRKTVITESSKL